jgi:hypothetical protein
MKPVTTLCALAFLVLVTALPIRAMGESAVQEANLEQMITNAKTPADHEAIATYYDREAADNASTAEFHRKLAKAYADLHIKPTDMRHHCEEMAKYFAGVARDAKLLAAEHREMAKKAK